MSARAAASQIWQCCEFAEGLVATCELTAVKAGIAARGVQYDDLPPLRRLAPPCRMLLSRRAFLRAGSGDDTPAVRPPWALGEPEFVARCTRCGDCLRVCGTGVIVAGHGGFPRLDFTRGECTFCGDCVTACAPAALQRRGDERPWQHVAAIGDACLAPRGVECRVCGESCDARAIRFRPRLGGVALPELDAAACTGCGACVAPCPTQAITLAVEPDVAK